MVSAPIDVIDRGGLLCDQNYPVEGNTLGSHDDPDPETDHEEIPVYDLVIDHPEGAVLRDTGSHEDALEGHWPEVLESASSPHDADERSPEGCSR